MATPIATHATQGASSIECGTLAPTSLTMCPVILAGGVGARLWPLSREHYPKQLIELIGNESLLQSTARRLQGLTTPFTLAEHITVVCGDEHRFTTLEQLHACQPTQRARLLLEPQGRDSAPALTIAALDSVAHHEDALLVVMPADHLVADINSFQAAIAAGAQYASAGMITTLGITPTHAQTGYGYLKLGEPLSLNDTLEYAIPVYKLERFVEKPHIELANHYVASGNYWWNSGIFIMRASTWLHAIEHFEPDIHSACIRAYTQGQTDGDFFRLDAEAFAHSPANSIDYAVMERLHHDASICTAVVAPLDAGWSDVGSWDAIWQTLPKDSHDNVTRGHVMLEDAQTTLAHSEGRLIACVGTRDLIVVETADAVLVADRSHVQDVKKIVGRLKKEHGTQATHHRKVHRPWGHYDSIDKGERFQVKHIVVKPGACLSLQMHHHRAEHWIVVRGTARVTRGDETFLLSENESTYIPLGVTHRLENPGKLPLEIVEVQSGAYLDEDDIVRLDDVYRRR